MPRIQHQTTDPGTPSLLPYAALVDPGILLNKNGAFMAGWHYTGPDDEALSHAQRNQITLQLNRAFRKLGSEWMLHMDAIRYPESDYPGADASHFPDPATRLIDNERRRQFQRQGTNFNTLYALVATYLPKDLALAGHLLFSKLEEEDTPFDKTMLAFKAALRQLEDDLSVAFHMQRLTTREHVFKNGDDGYQETALTDDLANHCRRTLDGRIIPLRLCEPNIPIHMDYHIGALDFLTGINPIIGEQQIAAISIDSFPNFTTPGILATLSQIGVACRWSTRFIFQDAVVADRCLKKQRSIWQGRIRGFIDQLMNQVPTSKSVINQDAQRMVSETDAALSELSSGQVGYGYYTSVLILLGTDSKHLDIQTKYARQHLERLGFSARIETLNTVEAFLGSLPGVTTANIRRPLLPTTHLANLLPTSSVWAGDACAPNPMLPASSPPLLLAKTNHTTPFRLNLHVSDVGHTLIFGPTGAGKSTLLALLAAQFRRYKNATITVFDKGRSMQVLTMATGGDCYDLADPDIAAFAPLAHLAEDRTEMLWANGWVETLANLQGVRLLPAQRAELNAALEIVKNDPEKTMTTLHIAVQDPRLKEALMVYTVDGTYKETLDADADRFQLSNFTCIETGELMNLDDKIKLPVLTYLFRQVERAAKGQPYLLILDEAWLMLSHDLFREKIREWLKTLRKANVAVVLATQSLSDANNSGIMDVLAESCPTKIYLPNPEATNPAAAGHYRTLGLLDEELARLARLTPKKEYYITGAGKRTIELGLGEVALAFTAASTPQDIADAKVLYRQDKDNFAHRWLQHKQVSG